MLALCAIAGSGYSLSAQVSDAHPSVSPDGTRIVFDSDRTGNGDVYVMNADGSDDRMLGKGTIQRWFPDSRRMAYMAPIDGGWQIHVVDVVSGEVTVLTR
jgi:TolB protein